MLYSDFTCSHVGKPYCRKVNSAAAITTSRAHPSPWFPEYSNKPRQYSMINRFKEARALSDLNYQHAHSKVYICPTLERYQTSHLTRPYLQSQSRAEARTLHTGQESQPWNHWSLRSVIHLLTSPWHQGPHSHAVSSHLSPRPLALTLWNRLIQPLCVSLGQRDIYFSSKQTFFMGIEPKFKKSKPITRKNFYISKCIF